MQLLFFVILFCLFLLILSEPLYIRVEKGLGLEIDIHFVFFSISFTRRRTEYSKQSNHSKKRKISFQSYIGAWVKLRKRVKIKVDALYFPFLSSPFTEALLCGLFPTISEGKRAYANATDISFAIHIETTLPDCLILYFKARKNEKNKR